MHSETNLFFLQSKAMTWIRHEKRLQSTHTARVGSKVLAQKFVNTTQCNQKIHTIKTFDTLSADQWAHVVCTTIFQNTKSALNFAREHRVFLWKRAHYFFSVYVSVYSRLI